MQLSLSYLAKSPDLAKSPNPVGPLANTWPEGDGQDSGWRKDVSGWKLTRTPCLFNNFIGLLDLSELIMGELCKFFW